MKIKNRYLIIILAGLCVLLGAVWFFNRLLENMQKHSSFVMLGFAMDDFVKSHEGRFPNSWEELLGEESPWTEPGRPEPICHYFNKDDDIKQGLVLLPLACEYPKGKVVTDLTANVCILWQPLKDGKGNIVRVRATTLQNIGFEAPADEFQTNLEKDEPFLRDFKVQD